MEEKELQPESTPVEEGVETEEGVAHYLTKRDLRENPDLEAQGLKKGDLIFIPKVNEIKDRTRECTCGRLVMLPNEGEGPTKCDCGVEHIW